MDKSLPDLLSNPFLNHKIFGKRVHKADAFQNRAGWQIFCQNQRHLIESRGSPNLGVLK